MIIKFEQYIKENVTISPDEKPCYLIILNDRYSSIEKKSGEFLSFCKLEKITQETQMSGYHFDVRVCNNAEITILDYVSEIDQEVDKSIKTHFEINEDDSRLKILYKCDTKKECQNKFKELKIKYMKEWEFKNHMNKFNV